MNNLRVEDLFESILNLEGLSKNIFIHSNIHLFGFFDDLEPSKSLINKLLNQDFTIVVPSYTYSFGESEKIKLFDPSLPASLMGIFSETVRTHPDAERTEDPMFSVSAVGPNAGKITNIISSDSFGYGSPMQQICDGNFSILCFNHIGATILHYYERLLNVSYRYNKVFNGMIQGKTEKKVCSWIAYVRDLKLRKSMHSPRLLHEYMVTNNLLETKSFGRGVISHIRTDDYFKHVSSFLSKWPDGLVVSERHA